MFSSYVKTNSKSCLYDSQVTSRFKADVKPIHENVNMHLILRFAGTYDVNVLGTKTEATGIEMLFRVLIGEVEHFKRENEDVLCSCTLSFCFNVKKTH